MSHARIIITCPEFWKESMVDALADRLITSELPQAVGVEVHSPEHFMERVIRDVEDE